MTKFIRLYRSSSTLKVSPNTVRLLLILICTLLIIKLVTVTQYTGTLVLGWKLYN